MTPIPFLIASAIVAIVGIIIVIWAEKEEEKEIDKLLNYAKAEAIQKARGKFFTLEFTDKKIA